MPLKINVGLSQKIGLPDYGSLGASCHVEFEADPQLLRQDLDGFQRQVADAFVACKQAVQDELHRHSAGSGKSGNGHAANGQARPAGNGQSNGQANGARRQATSSQIRAINAIAQRLELDLNRWLYDKYGLRAVSHLTVPQASSAIQELNELPADGVGGSRS
jgi:hypothetical protein